MNKLHKTLKFNRKTAFHNMLSGFKKDSIIILKILNIILQF
jgi:hypothetical protein